MTWDATECRQQAVEHRAKASATPYPEVASSFERTADAFARFAMYLEERRTETLNRSGSHPANRNKWLERRPI
jgi:hypothetical protein